MANWQKAILGLLLASGLLLGLAATLVHLYVTPERVQSLVQEGLESALQRKVTLGAVRVGLFRGITLEKLTILTRQQDDTLLAAENIDLSYDFSALLHGELLLGKILIKNPQLRLMRQTDGRLNIADLLGQSSSESPSPAVTTQEENKSAATAIPFLIKQFSLEGGTLLFVDRKMNEKSPYRYRLDDLNIDVQNFSLDTTFPVKLSANLNGSALALNLQFGLREGLSRLQLQSTQLDLVPFLPYFQEHLPGSLGRGLLSTELDIQKQAQGFSINGELMVEELNVSLNLDKPLHWDKVRIALGQDLFYRPADKVLDVKELTADIDGLRLAYVGKLQLGAPLHVAGEADIKIADLRQISALLPQEQRQKIAAYGIAGNLDAQLQLSGPATGIEVIQQAKLKASDLQANIGELRPALNGTFNYAAGRIQAELIGIDLKDQHLVINLDVQKIFSALPALKLNVTSDKINLDELFPPAAKVAAPVSEAVVAGVFPRKASTAQKPLSNETLIAGSLLKFPVAGRIDLLLNQLLYQGLVVNKVQGLALLQDGHFKLESLTASLADGDVALTVDADLEKSAIPVQGNFTANTLKLGRLADVLLAEGEGSISGTLTTQGQFSTLALVTDPLAAATGQGVFDLKDGELKGSPLLRGLAKFLSNTELELLDFSSFNGTYGLKKGQGRIDARMDSRRITIAPKGEFTLAGQLNIALETRISPEVMANAGIVGNGLDLLKDDKGWSLLPLKVKGDYREPQFSLDSQGLKKSVVNELGRQLQKHLKGSSDDPQKQQIQQLLDGTLNKLFGN